MESLVTNGEIYCNTTTFFRQYDASLFRGDSAEGSSFNQPGIMTGLTINGTKMDTHIEAQLNFFDGSNDGNIYSLFGIELATFQREKSGEYKYDVDRSCLQFGEYVVLITNPREFIRRLRQCMDLEQISYKIEPVTYLDSLLSGKPDFIFICSPYAIHRLFYCLFSNVSPLFM